MLILIKNNEGEHYSKHTLGKMLGVSSSSVQIWRKMYEKGGIHFLLEDKRIGFKPSLLTKEEHGKIEEKLHNPTNGLTTIFYFNLQRYTFLGIYTGMH